MHPHGPRHLPRAPHLHEDPPLAERSIVNPQHAHQTNGHYQHAHYRIDLHHRWRHPSELRLIEPPRFAG